MPPTTSSKASSKAASSSDEATKKVATANTGVVLFVDRWSQVVTSLQTSLQQKQGKPCQEHIATLSKAIKESKDDTNEKENTVGNSPKQYVATHSFLRVGIALRDVLANIDIVGIESVSSVLNIYKNLYELWILHDAVREQDRSTPVFMQQAIEIVLLLSGGLDCHRNASTLLEEWKLNISKTSQQIDFVKLLPCLDMLFIPVFSGIAGTLSNQATFDMKKCTLALDAMKYLIATMASNSSITEADASKFCGVLCKQLFCAMTSVQILAKSTPSGTSLNWTWEVLAGLLSTINESSTIVFRQGKLYAISTFKKVGSLVNFFVQQNIWGDGLQHYATQWSQLILSLVPHIDENEASKENLEMQDILFQVSLILSGKVPKTASEEVKKAVCQCVLSNVIVLGKANHKDLLAQTGPGYERLGKLVHYLTTLILNMEIDHLQFGEIFEVLRRDYFAFHQLKMVLWEDSRSRLQYYQKQQDTSSSNKYIAFLSTLLVDEIFGLDRLLVIFMEIEKVVVAGKIDLTKINGSNFRATIIDVESQVKAKVKSMTSAASSSGAVSSSETALLHTLVLLAAKVFVSRIEEDSGKKVDVLDICLANVDKILDALVKLDRVQVSTQWHVILFLQLVIPSFFVQLAGSGGLHNQVNVMHKLHIIARNDKLCSEIKSELEFLCSLLSMHVQMQSSYWNLPVELEMDVEVGEAIPQKVMRCIHLYQQTLQLSEQSEDIVNLEECMHHFSSTIESIASHNKWKYHTDGFSIRGWLHLAMARLLWLVYGDLTASLQQAKLALSYVINPMDCSYVKLDAVLHVAELYEHVGKLSKCMDYIAEGLCLVKSTSLLSLRSTWFITTSRIWYRSHSDKMESMIAEYCQDVQQQSSSKISKFQDDILIATIHAMQVLPRLFPSIPSLPTQFLATSKKFLIQPSEQNIVLQFRRMAKFWGLGNVAMDSVDVFGSLHYTSYINVEVERQALYSYLNEASFSLEDGIQQYVELIQNNSLSIDIIRDLRRKTCSHTFVDSSSSTLNKSTAWESFLFAAASCFPSTDLQFSTDQLYNKEGKRVAEALLGKQEAVESIEYDVKQVLTDLSLSNAREDVVCCCCIDKVNQMFIISTYSLTNQSQSIAIPYSKALQDVIAKWKSAMDNNQSTLKEFRNIDTATKITNKQREAWWTQRQENDEEILACLSQLQAILLEGLMQLFPSIASEQRGEDGINHNSMMMEDDDDDGFDRLISDMQKKSSISKKSAFKPTKNVTPVANVKSKSAPAPSSIPVFVDYDDMKLVDLRAMLRERGLSVIGKKSELVSRLQEYDQPIQSLDGEDNGDSSKRQSTSAASIPGHTIFILDEDLHAIPFESMPFFRHRSCSRVPSLSLLLQMISHHKVAKETRAIALDLSQSWYAVDIENNLASTRVTMEDFLKKYQSLWSWPKYVGCIPDVEFVRSYHSKADLFIFCGHGSGDKIPLHKQETAEGHSASALLWGCSSVKLQQRGVHDPTGVILQHLSRGAACVAGNLWDVTDKDLDKLCMDCMEKSFANAVQHASTKSKSNNDSKCISISESIIEARDICKLKYAVGSAAVVYGLPVAFH